MARWFKVRLGSSSEVPQRVRAVTAAARQFGHHQRARHALAAAQEAQHQATTAAEQHAAALSATVDDAQALTTRARDLRASTDLVREALERAKLLALNAGLEGARLGEPAGRILVTLADEVRTATARGLESLGEHVQLLAQVDRERERLGSRLTNVSQGAGALAGALAQMNAEHETATRALDELESELRRTPGADPDAARTVADASRHAQALLQALGELSPRARRNLLLDALQPLLRRLVRLLDTTSPGTANRD